MRTASLRTALTVASILTLGSASALTAGCGKGDSGAGDRVPGQSEFSSAPPIGQGGQGRGAAAPTAVGGAEGSSSSGGSKGAGELANPNPRPEVKETDLYRVDGDRLYYLNSYRGLMVFDIANVDNPRLLGRSAVFGTPVEMYVRNGIATIVIGDWYGNASDGSPFHGSVVRTVNAQNPAAMQVTGEVQVKGWARDMRVVGNNLYIVSEDYGWYYGIWYYGEYYGGSVRGDSIGPGSDTSKVVISSVSMLGDKPELKGTREYDGYSGAFNVTSSAIVLAHDMVDANSKQPIGKARLEYIDITDLGGAIVPKGSFDVDGLLQGWSADNGRWNVNLDQNTAEVLTCAASSYGYCNGQEGYNLTTIDFTDKGSPKLLGKLSIPGQGWAATARFFDKRMYLSPREGAWLPNGQQQPTPVQIYDLSTPATPKLAGQTSVSGAVWLFMPLGTDRLFVLGNDYGNGYSSSKVALRYLDVTDAANPSVIGTSYFGDDWAWTPASNTFKAFVRDSKQKLVVLPFGGWSNKSYEYTNGVQLIEYDTGSITTRGAAKSKGWVERGIFVKNRVVSLSDQALTVVDHTDRANPKLTNELTLARNVVAAEPHGSTITQLSTDWWGYDNKQSELRVLPIDNAEENRTDPALAQVNIDGTDARVYRNGDLAYVVSMLYPTIPNQAWNPKPQIQVVDLANGGAVLKGKIQLPDEQNGYYWGWWGGCWYYDWYDGSNAMQVGSDVLAFRRVHYWYNAYEQKGYSETKLYVVDLSDANAPKLASTTITPEQDGWWGNMRVVGDKLYTTHYEWIDKPLSTPNGEPAKQYFVKYYLDQIDLSDRTSPKVGKRINVPGMLVGASETDPSILYFIDYRWYGNGNDIHDELAVAKIVNDKAYLQSNIELDGWVGRTIVRGNKAYMSAQDYAINKFGTAGKPVVKLHEIDLTDPANPVDRSSKTKQGWGWLLEVQGDRAIITSGWGQAGIDIYRLNNGQAPVYDQFARTRGWWPEAITRQNDDLFVSTGYWGVQKIGLKH